MSTNTLPTAEDLEKLPVRAVVAYAARVARRLATGLREIIDEDILEQSLRLVESVATVSAVRDVDGSAIIRASERVAGAYASIPESRKSLVQFNLVFPIVQASLAAMYAQLASEDPPNGRHQMKMAAQAAYRAARPIDKLGASSRDLVLGLTRMDYEVLRREYGEHDQVVIGVPVNCFAD